MASQLLQSSSTPPNEDASPAAGHHLPPPVTRGSSLPQHPAQREMEACTSRLELFSCTLTTVAQGKKRGAPPQHSTISTLQMNLQHFCNNCWLNLHQHHHLTTSSSRSQEVHSDTMQLTLCLYQMKRNDKVW